MRKTLLAATLLLATLSLNAQKGKWTVYDTQTSDICGNNVSALATDGSGAWVGTFNGLCRLKGTGWMDYAMFNEKLKDQSINCLMVDKKGTLWVGTDDFGVVEFDGTNWTEHDDVTRRLKMKFVKEMVVDHEGVMWNAGISIYNGVRWLNYTTENSGLPDNIVPAVAIDKKNVKWFGTLNGLARYDGEKWQVWNTQNSPLPANQVNDIVIDVSDICTSTPKYVNGLLDSWTDSDFRQEAVIRHLGGTLPFKLTIGSTELPEHKGVLGANPDEKYTVTGWNKDTHNISVRVKQSGSETVYNTLGFPKAGEAPMIIAVEPTVDWMEERTSVPESWFIIPSE